MKEVRTGKRGRPRKEISKEYLQEALALRGTSVIGRSLNCHPRTVRRRALEHELVEPATPVRQVREEPDGTTTIIWTSTGPLMSAIANNPPALDQEIARIQEENPRFGQGMTQGSLLSGGFRVPLDRVVESLVRINGPAMPFGPRTIQRRVYDVVAVNSLWHHDGHHARMIDLRGPNRGSYIWGRSVHNIRIERLWKDYYIGLIDKWYHFFHDLEAFYGLDVDNPIHLWLLHHLFLPALNEEAQRWAASWNHHRVRTERNRTPREMFLFGMQEQGTRGVGWMEDGVEPGRYKEYGIDWALWDTYTGKFTGLTQRHSPGYPVTTPRNLTG
ncbi:hypothetical protein DFP72DRAFT_807962 [Ephemerocybe angulata]|uniref:Integrase core domain-containing protein n=1 Tax=Ephemerocybe angulata TaxID=980116 RepID=A0A8H6I5R7_9AGAR|nr:hypothetical protein DFP72DRAFT_807962 [Tulosesus angulatus]